MPRIPIFDWSAPIACAITPGEVPDRVALLERLRAGHTGFTRTEHGLAITFPDRRMSKPTWPGSPSTSSGAAGSGALPPRPVTLA